MAAQLPRSNQRKTTKPRQQKNGQPPARAFRREEYPRVMPSAPEVGTGGTSDSVSEDAMPATATFPEPHTHAHDKLPAEKKHGGRAAGRAPAITEVKDGVTALYATVGTLWAFANQYDGIIILERSEQMAESLIAACRPYPRAWKALQVIARGNVWTVLLMAHTGPMVAIAANHGILHREMPARFGLPVPPPRETHAEQAGPSAPTFAEQMAAQAEEQAYAEQTAANLRESVLSVANGTNGGNAHLMGDESEARALFTQDQIARIRDEAIAKALQERQHIAPDAMPPDIYNPLGGR